jgi:thiol-disulfide isomerase/thioredoxin
VSLASRPTLAVAALSLLAAAAYLGLRSAGVGPGPDTQRTAPMQPARVTELPEFVLDDLAGTPTPISSWPGKPLIINFWATWCGPCLREIPMLKAFQDEHPQIQVVGIAIDSVEPVKAFAADMQFNYPVLVGPEAMQAAVAFGIEYLALPLTVFVGSDRAVLATHLGELHAEHLANAEAVFADLAAGRSDLAAARARLEGRR